MIDLYLFFKIAGILCFVYFGVRACALLTTSSCIKSLTLVVSAVFLGYIGSTFWYVIQHYYGSEPYDRADLGSMLDGAGSVLYGWILGGVAGVWVSCCLLKIDFLSVLDRLAPWLLVAQILNRFGCFSGECCYGRLSGVPWAVHNSILEGRVHPVQLYEASWDAVILVLLMRISLSGRGRRTAFYFIAYPAGRFWLETFRGDNGPAFAGLTVPQLTSLVLILIALPLWFRRTARV